MAAEAAGYEEGNVHKDKGESHIRLSIIIPYYNVKNYTDELLDVLDPQMSDQVEVILVDDGSPEPFKTNYSWCKVFRKENGGCATARNVGLEHARGDYICFIDADDLVPKYFVERLFRKFDEKPYDVIDFSWKSLSTQGPQHNYSLKSDDSWLPNPSVCTRCFKRSFIGDIRFNELKDSTEDEDFSRKIGFLDKNGGFLHGAIPSYMYFYRTAITDSKIKRFKAGRMKTKRVTYYYDKVTKDMTWLLDEIKREDMRNEVWLLTNHNEIPELKRYCQIHAPMKMWTHYLRGQSISNIEIINVPLVYDVIIFCEYANKVGGISTFIYEWCLMMHKDHKILFMYDKMDEQQLKRLARVVDCERISHNLRECDTLILNRLTDKIPSNVIYKKVVQMVHACSQIKYQINQDRDFIVNVSQAAKDSWGEASKRGIVIHNPMFVEARRVLRLVSATRIGAVDKGANDDRYLKLADMLHKADIPFIWLNFSDKPLPNAPKDFINMPSRLDVQGYIRQSDYLVQLSDREAYSMAILEALCNETAVICTPIPSVKEQGVVDGKNGYIIPYDMNFDVRKLLNIPLFYFDYDNGEIKRQWEQILNSKPTRTAETTSIRLQVIVERFLDLELNREFRRGSRIEVRPERAKALIEKGIAKRI